RGMDTKPPPRSERSKPRHELQLTRPSQPPYPWPPEQAQPGVSKPCRTTNESVHGRLGESFPLPPACLPQFFPDKPIGPWCREFDTVSGSDRLPPSERFKTKKAQTVERPRVGFHDRLAYELIDGDELSFVCTHLDG